MADTEYLLPEGGFYNDTEQGKEILLPEGSFIKEQTVVSGSFTSHYYTILMQGDGY